eukprot:GFUD01030364.1.p1 GENE.GFUD01030364.1~~GFUD01030364.1.p1  ORF type:complete len:579 (-),score=205.60 GFUD01030364.1:61-1797(-)
MSGRRIKLDLSDFVKDVGYHRWMFLSDTKFTTVSDLVEQLREEYSQLDREDMVQVFMGGEFVIPPWESIQILQAGDLVRVVRTVTKRGVKKKFENKSRNVESKVKKKKQELSTQKSEIESVSRQTNKSEKIRTSSSSSSDSDTTEDITSKVTSAPDKKKKTCVIKQNNPAQKETTSSDSSDSSSEESEEPNNVQKGAPNYSEQNISKQSPRRPIRESSSSSSSTTSDDNNKSKDISSKSPGENILNKYNANMTVGEVVPVVSEKQKCKRKRKNKNKNKLAPDQIPTFELEVIPTESAIRHQMFKDKSNDHIRFEKSEEMEVAHSNSEEFTADQIQELYSQSVSSHHEIDKVMNRPQTGLNASLNLAIIAKNESANGEKSNVSNLTFNNSLGGEDVMKEQIEDKIVTNNQEIRTASKTGFMPRLLSLKEMKIDFPRNRNLKFSNQVQGSDLSNPSLMNCMDTVFNKSTGLVDVYTNKSVIIENRDYTAYPAVSESGPRVGDVIAFKVVEMGDNYAPEVSEYKEGKVLECDGKNMVTFELIKVANKKRNGKFEIHDQEEQFEKVVTLSWSELIEPKLMFP